MKKLLLLSSFFLIAALGYSQSWLLQNSNWPIASTGVYDFSVPSENVAWALPYDGSTAHINYTDYTRTIDGGTTWLPGTVTLDTNYQFSNICAINGDTAWVCMFKQVTPQTTGKIFQTTDGGNSWNQQGTNMFTNTATSFPNFVYFWNANEGMTMGDPESGYFEIYTTADGGTTWTRVPSANIPAPLSTEYGTINFFTVQGNDIWFWTTKGRLLHSTDKGIHWTVSTIYSTLNTTTQFLIVRFANSTDGLAIVGNTNAIDSYKVTDDGGATWTAITPIPANLHKGDLIHIPGTNIWMSTGVKAAATSDLGSSYSTDGGLTWTEFSPGVQHYKLGSYSLTATYNGGFSQTGGFGGIFKYDGTAVKVNEMIPFAEQSVYPNPSSGLITLKMKTGNQNVNLLVVDALGRVAFEKDYQSTGSLFNQTIDLTFLAKGVYSLVIVTGNERSQEKIVIQ